MQDKLITDAEEMAKALWVSWGGVLESPGWETFAKTELGENYRKGCLAVLAAVRAHDAGTDEELRNAQNSRIHETWVCAKCGYGSVEHSLPNHPSLQCIYEPILRQVSITIDSPKMTPTPHAAESTAQLDAEDPAEPVEDVVSRMCELMGGCACEHCIKRMTAALAVAREGYVSPEEDHRCGVEIIHWTEIAGAHLCRAEKAEAEIIGALELIPESCRVIVREGAGPENAAASLAVSIAKLVAKEGVLLDDVEKAARQLLHDRGWDHGPVIEGFLKELRARLAPKPPLAEEMEPILTKHFKTIGVVDCATELAALVERRTK